MRKALLLILLFGAFNVYCQNLPVDPESKKIVFMETKEAPGQSQEVLYKRAKEWMIDSFRSIKHTIEADDKEAGLLIGKAYSEVGFSDGLGSKEKFLLEYTFKINFKQGKYRYEISNLQFINRYNLDPYSAEPFLLEGYKYKSKVKIFKKQLKEIQDDTLALLTGLSASLEKKMVEENW